MLSSGHRFIKILVFVVVFSLGMILFPLMAFSLTMVVSLRTTLALMVLLLVHHLFKHLFHHLLDFWVLEIKVFKVTVWHSLRHLLNQVILNLKVSSSSLVLIVTTPMLVVVSSSL